MAGYYRILSLVGLNAVECAVALQCRMADANGALPAERRIELRAGINLGDVVVEGGDLFGDRVNVAARLQEVAEPGGRLLNRRGFDLDQNVGMIQPCDTE